MYVGELVEVLRGGKVSEMVPGGFGSNFQRKALYKSLSDFQIPNTQSPCVYLHLITDREEGFRTAVWFPVNANGTPVELILHFSVHKSM